MNKDQQLATSKLLENRLCIASCTVYFKNKTGAKHSDMLSSNQELTRIDGFCMLKVNILLHIMPLKN